MRIGHGFDVHQFAQDRPLIIGGVSIAHPLGLAGHSDADVLLHAICDALLGAAGLGDIGRHFPESDDNYKNIDSRVLLRHVMSLLHEKNFAPTNIDATIVAQQPKMAPYIETMRQHIAEDLQVDLTQINVKATTTENLGSIGREEGIAAHAVCLIDSR